MHFANAITVMIHTAETVQQGVLYSSMAVHQQFPPNPKTFLPSLHTAPSPPAHPKPLCSDPPATPGYRGPLYDA